MGKTKKSETIEIRNLETLMSSLAFLITGGCNQEARRKSRTNAKGKQGHRQFNINTCSKGKLAQQVVAFRPSLFNILDIMDHSPVHAFACSISWITTLSMQSHGFEASWITPRSMHSHGFDLNSSCTAPAIVPIFELSSNESLAAAESSLKS